MQATAADAMGDVVTTLATIASILFFHFTDINIDGFVGLLVSLVVMWAGVGIARDTLEPLIGQPVEPETYRKITEFVESYDGILGSHDLIVHNYGPVSYTHLDVYKRQLQSLVIKGAAHVDPLLGRKQAVRICDKGKHYSAVIAFLFAEIDKIGRRHGIAAVSVFVKGRCPHNDSLIHRFAGNLVISILRGNIFTRRPDVRRGARIGKDPVSYTHLVCHQAQRRRV